MKEMKWWALAPLVWGLLAFLLGVGCGGPPSEAGKKEGAVVQPPPAATEAKPATPAKPASKTAVAKPAAKAAAGQGDIKLGDLTPAKKQLDPRQKAFTKGKLGYADQEEENIQLGEWPSPNGLSTLPPANGGR